MESAETPSNWGHDMNANNISVTEFEKLIAEAYEQKRKVKEMKELLEAEEAVLTAQQNTLMVYMEALGKTTYKSNHGTVSIKNKFSVKVPADPEAKAMFFAWLEENGLFEEYATVNSQKLNALYNSKLEEIGDPDFTFPGIGAGTSYKTISLLK